LAEEAEKKNQMLLLTKSNALRKAAVEKRTMSHSVNCEIVQLDKDIVLIKMHKFYLFKQYSKFVSLILSTFANSMFTIEDYIFCFVVINRFLM
jgi:hypothetical protein